MPSGAKKRKAAKKKKEQAANNINTSTNNNNNNDNPHGIDDPRSQDERDSDGGDVGSPASQGDHKQQQPFNQGEEEWKRDSSPVQSHITEDKSVEEVTRDTESTEKSGLEDDGVAVKIEKELVPEKDLESTCVTIRQVKHDKSSSSSSSSSRSSSDDESQATEKKSKELTSYADEDKSTITISEEAPKVAEDETLGHVDSNSAVETATVNILVNETVAKEVDHAPDYHANKSVSDVVESGLKESEEKLLPSVLPTSNGIPKIELEENEGKNFSSSGTATAESSNVIAKTQDSGSCDHSEKQPLVASTPPVVQRTSFLSCCGLFDAFTGSGR